MPEGDAVWRTARRLDDALRGQTLVRTDLRVPQLATTDLVGETVHEVVSAGKHLFARIGDASLHTHLGMDGSWRTYAARARWSRPAHKARVVLATDRVQAVGFLLRVVELLTAEGEAAVRASLGPDLLDPAYEADEAQRRVAADPTRNLGEALLDQSNVAGIGNIFRNELLYVRGLHPDAAVGDDPDLARTLATARRMLLANRAYAAIVTTGLDRRGQRTWVYGRGGEPCRRCGAPIERRSPADSTDRVTYWCPACQPTRSSPGR